MNERRVFKNAKWIIICKLIQSVLQLVIGMITARYLEPANYGLINYAASIVAFALPIMKLGFDSTLVSELVSDPEKEGEIMGTSLMLNFVSGTVSILGVCGFSAVANFGETETIIVCGLYSISIIFAALEMVQYWYQYKLLSKYSSVVMLIGYAVVSVYKIILLVSARSVHWFALSHAVEYSVIGIALLVIYHRSGGQKFKFSFDRAKRMLKKSKHYILASLMVVVIQNTDHIMLKNMISDAENGLYSAAITCTTIPQFVYIAIVDSFRPLLLSNKKEDQNLFEKNMMRLYSITLYMAFVQLIFYIALAPIMIKLLYGNDYLGSIPVLRILIFYFSFSLVGLIRNVWILAEEKQKYLWVINMSGAVANIIMNAFMIPLWGASGAAMASLITQFFANVVLGFIIPELRKNNYLMLRALDPVFFVKELRGIKSIVLRKKS